MAELSKESVDKIKQADTLLKTIPKEEALVWIGAIPTQDLADMHCDYCRLFYVQDCMTVISKRICSDYRDITEVKDATRN